MGCILKFINVYGFALHPETIFQCSYFFIHKCLRKVFSNFLEAFQIVLERLLFEE